MEISDFHKDFLEEVKATAAAEGEGSTAAFINRAAEYLINAEVLSDFTPAFYSGTGKNNRKIRVDGYVYDELDSTFNLIIADYTGDEKRETVTRSSAEAQFDRLLYFAEEAFGSTLCRIVEPSTPVADLIDLLRKNKELIRKFRLFLLTDGVMSTRIHDMDSKDYEDIPVECQIWDIKRIYQVCCSELGRQDIMIDFKACTNGTGIPCLEASHTNNEDYKSYLCIIPGGVLADIYKQYGSRLLEGNVRSFLSTKVAVNKQIRETILRIPQNFFAYNNGISATAMGLQFETTSEGRFITYAKDFQIINGGQTTASLANTRFKDHADLSQVYVQMKLTEIDSDADKAAELIRNISRSSNSQNKVNGADFFATHPFHVQMEKISRRVFAPASGGAQFETKWFYERARGKYIQEQLMLTKAEKARFTAQNPKSQVITKTDLAKIRNTWAENPHIVSKGAQTNFTSFADSIDSQWPKDKAQFNDKYFKDTVALTILFKHTEWIISNSSWYKQGYRANIVTYSIALLHHLITVQFPQQELNLQMIWNKQKVPDALTNELVRITKYVFDAITNPERGNINVTQWCKQEACWSQVQKCDIKLSEDISAVLIDASEAKAAERAAKKDQKIISEFEAQTKVLEYGADFWKAVKTFVAEKVVSVSPDQFDALGYAVKLPAKIPNGYQSKLLLQILEKAKANGFKSSEG